MATAIADIQATTCASVFQATQAKTAPRLSRIATQRNHAKTVNVLIMLALAVIHANVAMATKAQTALNSSIHAL